MSKLSKFLPAFALASLSILPLSAQKANAYQVDCAILLCLAGGWPASAECMHARSVFIRRITPFPVEPPLQIWRCPLGAAYNVDRTELTPSRIYEILHDGGSKPLQSFPSKPLTAPQISPEPAVMRFSGGNADSSSRSAILQLIAGSTPGADIDIRGHEFDFVRSIRLFHVKTARQTEEDKKSGGTRCERYSNIRQGTYGPQGGFSWRPADVSDLPAAHTGLEGYGSSCPTIFYHRSVFVDWRDHEGNYGFEQVNY